MKKEFLIFFLGFVFLAFSGLLHGAIPASERAALIALYNSTDGDHWTWRNGWKIGEWYIDGFAMPGTEGNWDGITVTADHVTRINLPSNNLRGSIPSEIGNLGQLRELSLYTNQLNGNIPSQLGNLSNLTTLSIGDNQLTGSIPSQLGNLKQVIWLHLDNNQLSGDIPSQLGNLSKLQELMLLNNQLTGIIPPQLGNLNLLKRLNLNRNQLSGSIPAEFGNLSSLLLLELSQNQLSGSLPSPLGYLSQLQGLYLDRNQLTGNIPSQLGNLSNLNQLYLYDNQLNGSIPTNLGNLSNLEGFNVHSNQLSGTIPSSLVNLSKLVTLDIGYNCLSATDPTLRNWLNIHDPDWEAHQDQCVGATIPTVTTSSVSSITSNSATCGGNVTSDGGATVTGRGVCWSTAINPTTSNSKTTNGTGTGSYSSNLTGLSANTPYYVRAYAINSKGTSYGENIKFTTESGIGSGIPTVSTNSVSSVTSKSAKCGGNITSDGGSPIIAKGVCWSTTTNPTISNSKTINGTGTGSFSSDIAGLSANTPYYVRAYATNSKGTAYGSNVSFTTYGNGSIISATERAALISLYNSTNGDNWINNSGWKDAPLYQDGFSMPGTEGYWYGITIYSGHVGIIEIWMENNVIGSLPSQLGNLSQLTWLIIEYQKLSGNIPPELGNLKNLTYLSFNGNHLTGNIPSELGNLSKLEYLHLAKNELTGIIPSSLTNLTKIKSNTTLPYLNISYNCLSATNPTLRAWLNSKQPDWEAHQDQCGSTLPETNPPFGSFATPTDGITVAGSIAVTGWALDDSGVASVKIYRSQSYIGDASFVEGARPDVANAYPEYPSNTKAGWGYMLLTNFLPDGPITLTAIATDLVGKTTELGSKTITIDNAHAIKPFGAIDSPAQGGTASGSVYRNNGWVLTPMPNKIPTNGSTINVYVDGGLLGHATYNLYRSDIANLFPDYANSKNAWGYYDIDTTKYSNGIHTIQWTATDNGGNTDGIGSRYFTIQNTSSDSAQSTSAQSMKMTTQQISTLPEYSSEPIYFSTGFHGDNECSELQPDEKGNHPLSIKELERVEIQLGQNYTDIQGYVMSGNVLNPLPIGSSLNAKTGTFSWSPGPGFVGSYSLVFVLTETNGQSFKEAIEIKIEPKFSN